MLANPVPYGIHVTGDFHWFTVLADPDLPLVQNKVSKQRRFGTVTEHCALFILRVGFRVGDGAVKKSE